ncbi:MAG TPA: DUF6624 domain-containing protein [Gemmatimonadales bacterium]
MRHPELRTELLELAAHDLRVRSEIASAGQLSQAGYHPQMQEVHRRNAERLRAILARHGWPDEDMVGPDGAEAAWLIVQHAIGDPALQRQSLERVQRAASLGAVPGWQAAFLEDRIRFFEGRPQLYGTQFDWDESGQLSPAPDIEDPAGVDARRRSVGLEPLAEATRRHRERAAIDNERPPADPAARRRELEEWARRVGWRR